MEGKSLLCLHPGQSARERNFSVRGDIHGMVVWSWRMNWTRCLKGGWRPSVLEGSCKDLPMIYRRVAALRVTLWVAKLLVTITAFGGGDGGARVSAEGFPWRGLLTHSGSVGHRFFCEPASDSLRLDGCRRYSCTSSIAAASIGHEYSCLENVFFLLGGFRI